ncbi:MAG: T9SS type A sorting domain-containing protein, partial [Actinobacteria bacterium]|nr:T9SS type A sorting domain-containing protein [Actinomycetota bacterium]
GVITTDNPFNGLARFFGVLSWGDQGPTTDLNGSGTVLIQQIHTENSRFRINNGKAFLQNVLISRNLYPQYVIGAEAKEVKIFASVAEYGFKMSNQAGDRVEADYNYKQGQEGIKIKTGWEDGEKQNDWNNTFYAENDIGPFSGETAPQCRAQPIDSAHTGTRALRISGHDNGSSQALVYFKTIASQIPVFGTTTLSYWLLPTDEGGRNVHIDILFTDGTRLTDFAPTAQDSLPLIAARGTVGQWEKVVCPIGVYASGKTTQTILAGYHNGAGAQDFSAFIDDLDVSTQGILPAPWQETHVGNAVPEGYSIYDNGSFYLKAGGLGLGMTEDAFHFVYQKLSGDGSITAKLESVDDLGVGAFAGIMMRRSDSTSSGFAALIVSPRYGVYSKWRKPGTAVASSAGHHSISTQTPLWLKLVRQGNIFSTYYSSDGTHWGEPLKQITAQMDSTLLVGLAAAGGFGTTLLNAQFSHVLVSSQVTSIKSDPELNLPRIFRISQNYPNPFNGQTEIEFDLPEDGHVQIAVYNLNGQKIDTLVDQFQPRGFYKINWQGQDKNGSAVSSGVYYYRIRFHQIKIVKRMVFLQ